jgi:hypothetical protein
MDDRPIFEGIQVSLTRGLQASPSIGHRSTCINPVNEERIKNQGDLANAKKISSILPEYIMPMFDAVNHDNIPRYFEYSVFTSYIPKGIRIVGSQLGQIPLLKHSDFNLADQKNYTMLAPRHYLMNTTGKKPHFISHPWINGLA